MRTSDSVISISAALVAAQAEFPAITRDKTVEVITKSGAKYEFSYAPLDSIIDKVRPVLVKHGLSFIQSTEDKAIVTRLIHISGEWIESGPVPVLATTGSPQDFGSGITYSKRYSLSAILGIASEDDDDANRASGNEAKRGNSASAKAQAVEAWNAIKAPRQESIRRYMADLQAMVDEGRITEAADFFYNTSGMDQEEQMGAWSLLDSKTRSQVKSGDAANKRSKK